MFLTPSAEPTLARFHPGIPPKIAHTCCVPCVEYTYWTSLLLFHMRHPPWNRCYSWTTLYRWPSSM